MLIVITKHFPFPQQADCKDLHIPQVSECYHLHSANDKNTETSDVFPELRPHMKSFLSQYQQK